MTEKLHIPLQCRQLNYFKSWFICRFVADLNTNVNELLMVSKVTWIFYFIINVVSKLKHLFLEKWIWNLWRTFKFRDLGQNYLFVVKLYYLKSFFSKTAILLEFFFCILLQRPRNFSKIRWWKLHWLHSGQYFSRSGVHVYTEPIRWRPQETSEFKISKWCY